MSRLLKALQKAHKEHLQTSSSEGHQRTDHSHTPPMHEHPVSSAPSKPFDIQSVFMVILIGLVGVGIYFNYNISSSLSSTRNGMAAISENFKTQDNKLEQMSKLIMQMDDVNNGQNKQFLARIDTLSVNVASQIDEVQKLSKIQYADLSKTIEEQEKSISVLSGKYEQLERSVRNYSEVNDRYVEQLNALKKKLAEINSAQPQK